jgi:hypothetical protein
MLKIVTLDPDVPMLCYKTLVSWQEPFDRNELIPEHLAKVLSEKKSSWLAYQRRKNNFLWRRRLHVHLGCQIVLVTTHQSGKTIPFNRKMYQISETYTKWQ